MACQAQVGRFRLFLALISSTNSSSMGDYCSRDISFHDPDVSSRLLW
jgi:hypothetical protein